MEHLGLSSGTVSIVLNGRGDELRISRETQKMVLDTAREMNYQSGKKQKKKQNEKYDASSVSDGWRIGVFWNLHYMGGLLGQFYSGFQETIRQSDEKVEIVLQPFEYDQLSEFADVFSKDQFHGAIIGGLSEADSKYLKENKFEIQLLKRD